MQLPYNELPLFLPNLVCAPSLLFRLQSFKYVGTEVTWVGEGVDEYGHIKGDPENVVVRVDPRYFRPTEVDLLLVSGSFKRTMYALSAEFIIFFIHMFRVHADVSFGRIALFSAYMIWCVDVYEFVAAVH